MEKLLIALFVAMLLAVPVFAIREKGSPDCITFEYYPEYKFCTQMSYTVREFTDRAGNGHYIAHGTGEWWVYFNGEMIGRDRINVQRKALTRDGAVTQLLRSSSFTIMTDTRTICFGDRIIKYGGSELKFIKDIRTRCSTF